MFALLLSAALQAAPPVAPDTTPAPTTWKIDVTHSELLFRIRHLVSRVTGTFTDWDGVITAEPDDWARGSVAVRIRTRSISTNNERRDNDLRSANFFLSDSFPEMTFRSTAVEVQGENLTLTGDLTIKQTTRPVTLTGSYLGRAPGREGRDRIGFTVSTKINRLDYGITWNRVAEGGGAVLGDEVTIEITVSAVKQLPSPAAPTASPSPPSPPN
jgi:polyisoprenoid-binding protein YceI